MQHRYTCSVLVSKRAILTCKMLLPWVITKASIACIMQSIFIATAVATLISGYFFWHCSWQICMVFYQISIHVFLSCLVLVWYFIPINFWLFSFITFHNFTGRVWKRTLNKTLTQQDELEGEWYTGLVLFWSIVDSLYIVYQLLIKDCYTTGFFISANNVNKDGRRWSTLILSGNVY